MSVAFNHTIVPARDKNETARHLTTILGLPDHTSYGPFAVVQLANGTSLDVADGGDPPLPQHYAFLVSEAEFDAIQERISDRGIRFWADPFHREEGRINHNDGGRGLYWLDPNGHSLEIITVPYHGAAG